MPPGRKTHEYPHGKPIPLLLVEIALLGVLILWVVFAHAWIPAVGVATLFFLLIVVHSKILEIYERRALAIPIARPASAALPKKLPVPMRILRYLGVLGVIILLYFGHVPLSELTARRGIIGSVIALFLLAGLYINFGWYYAVKEGS